MKFSAHEEQAIMHAVAAAERGSTGELRVLVLGRCKGDALEEAKRHFVRMGLAETRGRTGVLLLVCPRGHKAAILGDVGIHAKVGDAFWQMVIARAIGFFARGEILLGVLSAIDEIGQAFRQHLPGEAGEGNELPDRPEISP